jgi:outer membrane protein TolC
MVFAGQTSAATLQEVVEKIIQEHPDVRSAEAMLEASDAQVWQTYSKFLPVAGLSYQDNNGQQQISNIQRESQFFRSEQRLDGTLQWNLFNGFSDWYSIRSAEFRKEAAEFDLNDAHEAVALRVTEQYLEILRLHDRYKVANSYLNKLKKLAEDVQKQVDAGKTSNVTTLQAVAQQIQAENDIAQVSGQLAGLVAGFKIMGVDQLGNLIEPKFDMAYADKSLDQLLDTAVQSYRLLAAQKRVDSSDADVDTATGAMLPSLSLNFRQRFHRELNNPLSTDTLSNVGLQVNYQIPLGGELFNKRREAEAKKAATVAAADKVIWDIKTQLATFQTQLVQAKSMVSRLDEYANSTAAVEEAYELQFDAGKHSLIDFLITQRNQYQADISVVENHYTQLVNVARIGRQIGGLRSNVLQIAAHTKTEKNSQMWEPFKISPYKSVKTIATDVLPK